MKTKTPHITTDIVLIGAGIMSATLASLFQQLVPNKSIHIFERLNTIGAESSNAWNNAGTGHSALCELNYTPENPDGSINTSKALKIIEQFEVSKQFWSYLTEKKALGNPKNFIRTVPHMSFVHGDKDVEYLSKRYEALKQFQLFNHMEYSEDKEQISAWAPLVIEGRDKDEKIAATHSNLGTDVDFGCLTNVMLEHLNQEKTTIHLHHEVLDIQKKEDNKWLIKVRNLDTKEKIYVLTDFVFIGAGGGALHLLQKTDIPESKPFGGFPVGGQWLVCRNPEVVKHHHAKVYGQAAVGAPPMSVPHLDTREIEGDRSILFGPFATFSTKFLKEGSFTDLFKTIKYWNLIPMLKVGFTNFDLEKYLIQQLTLSFDDRIKELQVFFPEAKAEDWKLEDAGQRVQIIKNTAEEGGTLQFGTEIVASEDGSIAALLGASPGASTSVSIMLDLLAKCFPEEMKGEWKIALQKMIPSFGQSLEGNAALISEIRQWTSSTLQLTNQQEAL